MAKSRAKKQVPLRQGALGVEQHVLLKKPLDHLGKQIEMPGSFWQGRMSVDERETVYKCTIIDFSLAHKFSPDAVPTQAFRLQEMGVDGTGSLEKSDLESTKFWCSYPMPFLRHYYETFPEEDLKHVEPAVDETGDGGCDDRADGGSQGDKALKPDVLPDFPHIRLGVAPIYEFWTLKSDTLISMGPKSGSFSAGFQCLLVGSDGLACECKRSLVHKRDRACATSNLITHLREKAAVCEVHKAALQKVDAGNKNMVCVEGENVLIHNFAEAFSCACTITLLTAISLPHLTPSRHP